MSFKTQMIFVKSQIEDCKKWTLIKLIRIGKSAEDV